MRSLLRVALAVALLAAVVLAGLALYLPRVVDGPEVRARIASEARKATGREFSYADLSFGLLPPRLVLRQPALAGAEPGAPPFLEAQEVDLVLEVLPLLARAVVFHSLRVEGATLRLERTQDGIQWPRPPKREKPARPDVEEEREPKPKQAFRFAVREMTLQGVRLVLEDRAISPPVTWDLGEVEARAKVESPSEPIAFSLTGTLASGGRLSGQGTATFERTLDAAFELERVELRPVGAYLGGGRELAGGVSGTVRVRGAAGAPDSLEARLALRQGVVDVGPVRAEGDIDVEVELSGPPFTGPFRIDATAAELTSGGSGYLKKPPGTPATATGQIVPREDGGFDVDAVQVDIHNVDARGRIGTGPRLRAALSAPAFELAGWEALLPSLAGWSLGGAVALRDLQVATAPLELGGRIELARVRGAPPRSPPVELSGAIEGRGGSLVTQGLSLAAAGQTLDLSASLADLDTAPSLRLQASGRDLDSGALLRAYAREDAFDGPLTLDADLAAAPGAPAPLLDTLAGRVRADVGRGRFRGVSLLRSTSDALGALATAAVLANRIRGSRKAERFYEDEFESIGATLRIGGGAARTDDLHMVYRHYTVDLRGAVGLADGSLDMTGEITVDRELDAALAGEGAVQAGSARRPRRIPLAHVVGTLKQPRVDLSPEAIASLTGRHAFEAQRGKLEEEIDERLGEGSGAAVGDVLEGILGGRERKR